MRVLWLSPWMRPLARVHVEALAARGAEVMLVTSNQHPESHERRPYEVVLDPRFKDLSTWLPFLRAWHRTHDFAPDVVVAELIRDPRWMAIGLLAPRVQLIHDDRPHGREEERPAYERFVLDWFGATSKVSIAFSNYVANAIRNRRDVRSNRVEVVPLTSDLDAHSVPALVGPAERRDFVLVGRLNAYKNLDVVFDAWQQHVAGPGWRGDELVLVGNGSVTRALPAHTRWIKGTYSYADVREILAAAKGSIAHYRRASQSGVQVLSMQLGVAPIVSTEGALPEFQPAGFGAVGVDDAVGLSREFDLLADPETAAERGRIAAGHYSASFAPGRVADRLLEVFTDVVTGDRRSASPRSVAGPHTAGSEGNKFVPGF